MLRNKIFYLEGSCYVTNLPIEGRVLRNKIPPIGTRLIRHRLLLTMNEYEFEFEFEYGYGYDKHKKKILKTMNKT